MALSLTLILGLFFLAGMLVIRYASHHEWIEHISYAVAFGSLIALVFFDLVPEVLELFSGRGYLPAAVLTAVGVGGMALLDRFIPEHEEADEENPAHIGIMATVALIIHNIIEGMTVCSVAMTDIRSGMILALGVGLHNIPMGMLIYSSLKQEKHGKKIGLILMASLSTFLGGCLMTGLTAASNVMLEAALEKVLMCLAMGMILFILLFELAPLMLREKEKKWNLTGILAGAAIVILSTLLG